ncbi:hypothetical protein [Sphingomonas changnyeongensis]|nr:hypothetical protein [Sphingomonas changnyeongensis]
MSIAHPSTRGGAPGFVNPLGFMKNLSFMKLSRTYNGRTNDLRSYLAAKILADRPAETIDGARPAMAVVLPPGSPGELIDPELLLDEFYRRLPRRETCLGAQFTIYSPEAQSLWDEFDHAYQFARSFIAGTLEVPAIIIQHVPYRAGCIASPHVHILALGLKLGRLGFTSPQSTLASNCAQVVLQRAWDRFCRGSEHTLPIGPMP